MPRPTTEKSLMEGPFDSESDFAAEFRALCVP
jgi:hypothetical protein